MSVTNEKYKVYVRRIKDVKKLSIFIVIDDFLRICTIVIDVLNNINRFITYQYLIKTEISNFFTQCHIPAVDSITFIDSRHYSEHPIDRDFICLNFRLFYYLGTMLLRMTSIKLCPS